MSTIANAGLLIFRLGRQGPEFLLINDAFNHRRHWTPPKGKVIGQEDELKCAIRVAVDLVGLAVDDLQIDSEFAATLKYLSGTQAKNVVYYLAHLVDTTRALRIGAGINYAWLPLEQATDRAMYPNMQDVLYQAHDFISDHRSRYIQASAGPGPVDHNNPRDYKGDETVAGGSSGRRAYRPPAMRRQADDAPGAAVSGHRSARSVGSDYGHNHSEDDTAQGNSYRGPHQRRSPGDGYGSTSPQMPSGDESRYLSPRMQNLRLNHPSEGPSGGGSLGQRPSPADNPMYKTRMCERFEREGSCPYGPKCTFAHGISDLRQRAPLPLQSPHTNGMGPGYGDHGGRSPYQPGPAYGAPPRPNPAENPLYKTRLCEKFMRDNYCQYGYKCTFAHGVEELQNRQMQPQQYHTTNYPPSMTQRPSREPILLEPRTPLAAPPAFLDAAGRGKGAVSTDGVPETTAAAPRAQGTSDADSSTSKKSGEEGKSKTSKNKGHTDLAAEQRRPRVVELDAEELAKFGQPPPQLRDLANAPSGTSATSRLAQDETLASELRAVFPDPLLPPGTDGEPLKGSAMATLAKQVTRFEFRHNLAKQQLFHVLILVLLENSGSEKTSEATMTSSAMQRTLAYYHALFTNYLKSSTDQRLLLNAWDRFLSTHGNGWLKKAPLVFKLCYDTDLIEEDVFLMWNKETPDSSSVKKKVAPFMDWLSTAEEEEEDSE
ncbi:hypothetical protein IWQ62_001553 [Dispira parvispora]|uniref:Uncharacterized protein n=1 Tax=Dispira parvispora TaxID=1520584 RepID=A0A9W8AS36_9FUNG|nr:hypothetical protein IWQ62_001553 [Dispira parvispora]